MCGCESHIRHRSHLITLISLSLSLSLSLCWLKFIPGRRIRLFASWLCSPVCFVFGRCPVCASLSSASRATRHHGHLSTRESHPPTGSGLLRIMTAPPESEAVLTRQLKKVEGTDSECVNKEMGLSWSREADLSAGHSATWSTSAASLAANSSGSFSLAAEDSVDCRPLNKPAVADARSQSPKKASRVVFVDPGGSFASSSASAATSSPSNAAAAASSSFSSASARKRSRLLETMVGEARPAEW